MSVEYGDNKMGDGFIYLSMIKNKYENMIYTPRHYLTSCITSHIENVDAEGGGMGGSLFLLK